MKGITWNLGGKGLVLGIVVIVSVLLIGRRPAQVRLYLSTATCQVAPDLLATEFLEESPTYGGGFFISAEFEVVVSPVILDPVIHQFDLTQRFAGRFNSGRKLTTDQAREVLLRRLRVSQSPDLNAPELDVTVASEQPEEASTIANAVISRYQDYHRENRQLRYLRGMQQIEQEIILAQSNPWEPGNAPDGRDSIQQQQDHLQDLVRKLKCYHEKRASTIEVVTILRSATPSAERRWWQLEQSWLSKILFDLSECLGKAGIYTPA